MEGSREIEMYVCYDLLRCVCVYVCMCVWEGVVVGLADKFCFVFLVIEGKSDSAMANAKLGSVFRS